MIKIHKYISFILLAMILFIQGCGYKYQAEPMEAWVIDAKTGKPMKGVIVIAYWRLRGGMEGGNVNGHAMVMEAVTDKDGRFHFSGWGPKRFYKGYLESRAPVLIVYKSGYKITWLIDGSSSKDRDGLIRRSRLHKKKIRLTREMSLDNYLSRYNNLSDELLSITQDGHDLELCFWRKVPNIVKAMEIDKKRLRRLGVKGTLNTIGDYLLMNDEIMIKHVGKKCGSPKEFVERSIR